MKNKYFLGLLFVIPIILNGCDGGIYRAIWNGQPDPQTYKIFPERIVENAPPISQISKVETVAFPTTITFQTLSGFRTSSVSEILRATQTEAFIVVKDNKVIYEDYLDGTSRNTIHYSFSVSKSIVSTLIGIAIDEGKILSVDDPVVKYIPELKNRGLDELTIKDMLLMSTGIDYRRTQETFFFLTLFSPDITTFYGGDLRKTVLGLQSGEYPIGKFFNYNDYYPLIEGMILERATGMSISQYTQDKIWKPMGMEFNASWSIDKADSGFERTLVGFSASAIDFTRFGLLFLNKGMWDGHKILSQDWIDSATSPDSLDKREWLVEKMWPEFGGYYKYHWWGITNADSTFDYFASGNLGQIIYVSPSRNTVVVRFGSEPDPDIRWVFIIRALLDQIE